MNFHVRYKLLKKLFSNPKTFENYFWILTSFQTKGKFAFGTKIDKYDMNKYN